MNVEFGYIRDLRDEYNNVFLDSQMNIAERMKYAVELGKVLGNFDRLHHAVYECYTTLDKHGVDSPAGDRAMALLEEIADAYRARRGQEG